MSSMELDIEQIKDKALKELQDEIFREEVEKYKQKLKNKKSLWNKLFPCKILIIKKGK